MTNYKLNYDAVTAIITGVIITAGVCIISGVPVTVREKSFFLPIIIVTLSVISISYGFVAGIVIPVGTLIAFGKTGITFDILQNAAYLMLFGLIIGKSSDRIGIRDGKISIEKLISYYLFTFLGVNGLFVLARPLTMFLIERADLYSSVRRGVSQVVISMILALSVGTASLILISFISNKQKD